MATSVMNPMDELPPSMQREVEAMKRVSTGSGASAASGSALSRYMSGHGTNQTPTGSVSGSSKYIPVDADTLECDAEGPDGTCTSWSAEAVDPAEAMESRRGLNLVLLIGAAIIGVLFLIWGISALFRRKGTVVVTVSSTGDEDVYIFPQTKAALQNSPWPKMGDNSAGNGATEVQDKEAFLSAIEAPKDQRAGKPVLIFVYAPWCGWCKRLKPNFFEAAKKNTSDVAYVTLNYDALPVEQKRRFAAVFGPVSGIPRVVALKRDGSPAILNGAPTEANLQRFASEL